MKNLFIGLIFITFNFNLTLDNSVIGLFPDWLGYLFLIRGLTEMVSESGHFARVKPLSVGMAVYTAVLYVADLLGLSLALGYAAMALGFLSTGISLYILFHIVQGVIDMERERQWPLNGASLFAMWQVMAVCNILSYVLLLIPPLGIISLLVCTVVHILFLSAFYKARRNYETARFGG